MTPVSAFYLVLPLVWVELHVEHDMVNIVPGLTSKCTIAFLMVPTPENKSGYICDAAQVWGGPRAMEHTKEYLLPRRPGC